MTKAELLEQLQGENRQWEALLEEIGEERMDYGWDVGVVSTVYLQGAVQAGCQ